MKVFLFHLMFTGVAAFVAKPTVVSRKTHVLKMGYVPDGMSPEQYKKLQQKEASAKANKRFAAFGPQTFKSRSLKSFQEDLEAGKAGHLVPMFNAKEKLKKGAIKQEDIPYMQRGGSWDNSDVRGAKKKGWTAYDKKYNQNQGPARIDWKGANPPRGPSAAVSKKQEAPKKNGWFGL